MSSLKDNLEYPVYRVFFDADEFPTEDVSFYIVGATSAGGPQSALTGNLTTGSFESDLMAAIKTFVESRPGASTPSISVYQETTTAV